MSSFTRLFKLAAVVAALAAATSAAAQADHLLTAQISNITVVSQASTATTFTWKTSQPARSYVEYGLNAPSGSFADGGDGVAHTATLPALQPATTYQYKVVSVSAAGKPTSTQTGSFTSGAVAASTTTGTADGAVTLNGQPFLPIFSWNQCASDFQTEIGLGINTFMGAGCTFGSYDMASALAGRAYGVTSVYHPTTGIGVIGHNQPDEPEGYGVGPDQLPTQPSMQQTGQATFLTITNHFAGGADPISPTVPKTIYPQYIAKADVLGFDLYPYGKYCSTEHYITLEDVYLFQRDLVRLAAGKPTYQWIETGPVDGECMAAQWPHLDPAKLRAEVFLAFAGGARGIGYFTYTTYTGVEIPFDVSPDIQQAMQETNVELESLAGPLTAPETAVQTNPVSPVKVGARSFNGATYVIEVNSSDQPQKTTWGVPSLAPGTVLVTRDNQHTLTLNKNRATTDTLAPFEARVMIAAPYQQPAASH